MGWLPTRRVPCQLLHLPLKGGGDGSVALRCARMPAPHTWGCPWLGGVPGRQGPTPSPCAGHGFRAQGSGQQMNWLGRASPINILSEFLLSSSTLQASMHQRVPDLSKQGRNREHTGLLAGFCSKFIQQSAPDWATRVALSDSRYISSHFPFAPEQ